MKVAAILLLAIGSCAWLFEPTPIGDEWEPPAVYREIWAEAEQCTGKQGNYDRVRWGMVPGRTFKCDGKTPCIGYWQSPHQITIAGDWVNIRWVVKHEIIHDLTGYSHDGGKRDIQIWGHQCHAMWGYLE